MLDYDYPSTLVCQSTTIYYIPSSTFYLWVYLLPLDSYASFYCKVIVPYKLNSTIPPLLSYQGNISRPIFRRSLAGSPCPTIAVTAPLQISAIVHQARDSRNPVVGFHSPSGKGGFPQRTSIPRQTTSLLPLNSMVQ
jgi:hypothetical protein